MAVHLTPGADVDTLDLRLRLAACLERETDVDDDRVVQILQTRLDDLDQFVTTVAERLEQFG